MQLRTAQISNDNGITFIIHIPTSLGSESVGLMYYLLHKIARVYKHFRTCIRNLACIRNTLRIP